MASSVVTQLTISSTNATSDNLSILVNKTLATKEPVIGIARASVATSGYTELVPKSATDITYLYVKNTDSTNVLADDGGNDVMDVSPGEFAFIPVKATKGMKVKAAGAAVVAEYALFTKS